jgi:predicted DNA-binding transcriptional regulator YafY
MMRQLSPPITASRLAEEMDVSVRSIYRDIDSLRAAGARIEGERGFGYRLIEDNVLPPLTFSRAEIEVIALAIGEIRAMGDPGMTDAANAVLAKVAAALPDGREQQLLHAVSRVFRPHRSISVPDFLETVRQACWEEHALDIAYADSGGVTTRRTIFPLAIVYTDHHLTALAWCQLRLDFRMFRLDRMRAVARAGHSFRPRRVALLRDYIARLDATVTNAPTSPDVI